MKTIDYNFYNGKVRILLTDAEYEEYRKAKRFFWIKYILFGGITLSPDLEEIMSGNRPDRYLKAL